MSTSTPTSIPANRQMLARRILTLVLISSVCAAAAIGFWWKSLALSAAAGVTAEAARTTEQTPSTESDQNPPHPSIVVIHPGVGGLVRTTTQPGTVESFNYEDLYAKVSGYLQFQEVDIGSRVKAGQVLARIEAPELDQAVLQAQAELGQATAQVQLMEAGLARAKADVEAAQATVEEKRADVQRATAYLGFRKVQYRRIKDLYALKSIDERMVDETLQERDAAQAAESVAKAAIRTATAELGAKQAKVKEAEADVAAAKAKVAVAAAVLQKAKVFQSYTNIVSQYDGVITKRSFHVGEFIRAADQGGQTPLLTVAETDKMRVVIQMPDEYVPFTDRGDPAVVRLNFLDQEFKGTVSRISESEDRLQKTMRTEVDLENRNNELRDGMYGYVTIYLSKSLKGLSVPSTALVTSPDGKTVHVWVVRDGQTHRLPVKVAADNGVRAEIRSGLRPEDLIVAQPSDDLFEGQAVKPELRNSEKPSDAKK